MIQLCTLTIAFAAAAIALAIYRVVYRAKATPRAAARQSTLQENLERLPDVSSSLYFFLPTLLFLIAAASLCLLAPVALIFHDHRLPALIALVAFFAPPILALAFLWRTDYLGHARTPISRQHHQ